MKYAFTHGKLLDGTKDMQVQEGLCVLTDGERISAIVPEGTRCEITGTSGELAVLLRKNAE